MLTKILLIILITLSSSSYEIVVDTTINNDNYKASEFIRDESNNVVIETTKNLMWQDTQRIPEMTFHEADQHCSNLSLAGFNDWRLPTVTELLSLLEYTNTNVGMNQKFKYRIKYKQRIGINGRLVSYVTSTLSSLWAWDHQVVEFALAGHALSNYNSHNYVKCVR